MSAADLGNNPEKFSGDDCIVFIKNAYPFRDKKYRTIDHPRYHELNKVGEFDLEAWNYDRREDARRADARLVREVKRRMDDARSSIDPVFFG